MTLCVGWVDAEAVYLTADSAVTAPGKSRISGGDYSSFGEKQYQSAEGTVEESALKIFRHQDSAATFSGNASPINEIFANFVESSRYLPPRNAFDAAWISSHDPNVQSLEALFGYYDSAGPHLVKYDALNLMGEAITSACIGSILPEDKEQLLAWLKMPSKAQVTDRLVLTMCMTQRVAIFLNLMASHGIGGCVAGCLIGKDGLQWAPDTLHVILRGELIDQLSNDVLNVVLTYARFDTFFVCNNLEGGLNAFANKFGMNAGLSREEVVQRLVTRINNGSLPSISTELKVHHVVFHDVVTGLSTVFNVKACDDLKYYWLTRDDPAGPAMLRFTVSGNGLGALKRASSGKGGDIAFVG
ncbi:hypothetical protein JQ609_24225 [Bradyrhizobium sp. AUGA SZCCT0169]|uniref:hypothetical protein n=1 Tax=Bradyrhizobium sp. AUGA SZCCT0169 TaxID=2807663 RepID=UPI001BAB1763|nr:hypothetical protein [Bradyrhizobium sp. AUGA SZCCT0169]MBR1250019.1 hypothetical protein [Bradyrhizobium sp. AUGA SZCCT0169]